MMPVDAGGVAANREDGVTRSLVYFCVG
jgi:hypothetical protein